MDSNLIYDVGLHKGEDSESYLKEGFRVVAMKAKRVVATSPGHLLNKYIGTGQLIILNAQFPRKVVQSDFS
jgi:hypothetical protein